MLYHLAEQPEIYLGPLRKEVEDVVSRMGWTKAALREMVKVDSFVRESERFNGLSSCKLFYFRCIFNSYLIPTVIMTRKVVNPDGFTFSNGVHLPFNSVVAVANYSTHHNEGKSKVHTKGGYYQLRFSSSL